MRFVIKFSYDTFTFKLIFISGIRPTKDAQNDKNNCCDKHFVLDILYVALQPFI